MVKIVRELKCQIPLYHNSTVTNFEGGANDVPITNISRTIEIDLREMLNEQDIPAATMPQNNILM